MQILLIMFMLVVACYFMHLNYNILLHAAAAAFNVARHMRTHTDTFLYIENLNRVEYKFMMIKPVKRAYAHFYFTRDYTRAPLK